MIFSDLHVDLMARGLLQPGEQLVGKTVTSYMPWWALGFIRRQYLVLATDRRLVLLDHRYGLLNPVLQRLHGVESLPWNAVQEARVTGLFMKKKLKLRAQGDRGPVKLAAVVSNGLFGLFAPMRNNVQGAREVAAAFQTAAKGAPGLPPAAPHPGLGYGNPAPQLPAQNAPGYSSVPPPSGGHAGGLGYGAPPPSYGPPGTTNYPPRTS